MKTIGILGGMGPQATIDFENQLHLEAQKQIPQKVNEGYPKMVAYYFRQAPMEANRAGRPALPLAPNPELLKAAKELGEVCDFIVIPSNTPHFFKEAIENAAGKKLLDIVKLVVDEVKNRKAKKIGIISTGTTLKNRLYQSALQELGVLSVAIEEDMAQTLDKHIFKFMEGVISQEGHDCALSSLDYVRKEGAEVTILGCTEVPLLLGAKYAKAADLINPARLLAEAAIKYAIN